MEGTIRNPQDVKLNVRPLTIGLIHEYVFEGPCRFGKGDELLAEFDEARTAQIADAHEKDIKADFGKFDFVNVLDPIVSKRDETFPLSAPIIDELAADIDDVDLFVIAFYPFGIDLVKAFAQKYRKPIGVRLSGSAVGAATVAVLRGLGLECYGWPDWSDAEADLRAMRTRKILNNTRVLALVRNNSTVSISAPDSFFNHDEVKMKLGVDFTYMNLHEFVDQTHVVDPSTNPTLPGRVENNITEEEMVEIQKMTDELCDSALEVTMPRENVMKSVRAHYLARKLMAKLDCNAFTAPCPDMCATRRLNQEQFTFCLNHSLNNECGICSACEYDVSALLSMAMLSAMSESAPYMGNTIIVKAHPDKPMNAPMGIQRDKEAFQHALDVTEGKGGIVLTYHSTPNRKFHGFKTENDKFAIHPFAMDGRWGATMRYDFNADEGQAITVARFDPTCSKVFVTRGTILAGAGYNEENCSLGVFYSVPNIDLFREGNMTTGNHMCVVFGDVYDAVVSYAKMVGLEVLKGE